VLFSGQLTKNARMPYPADGKYHAVMGVSHVHGQSLHTEAAG